MRDTFFWSDADKNRIADYLVAGLSASKIAAHFDGVSRGAIIGVIHRDERLKAIGLTKRPPPRPKPELYVDTQKRITEPHTRSRIRLPPTPRKPDQAAPVSREMLLHELDSQQCKWPTNDPPKGGVFRFCGHQRAEKGPYCTYHQMRACRVDSVDR